MFFEVLRLRGIIPVLDLKILSVQPSVCSKGEAQMHDTESLLREYAKEITEIIEATKSDPGNDLVRTEIAAALAESLNRQKKRAGKDLSVKDTDLYRLAQAVKEGRDEHERTLNVKRAFPRRWSIICDKYNFDWKISCKDLSAVRRKGPPRKRAKSPTGSIEGEIEGLEKTMKKLDEQIGELTEEIRKREE